MMVEGVNVFEKYYWADPELLGIDNDDEYFVTGVSGDGMRNAGLSDKDKLVFRKTNSPKNGAIVYVATEKGVFCRRYFKDGEKIRLRRENGIDADVFPQKCKVYGELVTIIHKFASN